MPQFDAATFPSQLIWLIITFVALYLAMARVALPRIASVLEERQRRVSGDLDKAESLKAEAEQVLADYEKSMAEARTSAQELLRQTREELAAEAAERQQELAGRIAQNTQAAEQRIEAARSEAIGNIRSVAVEVAQAATRRLIGVEIDEDAAGRAVEEATQGGRNR